MNETGWLQSLKDNPEFLSGTANFLMALAWIYLFWRLTSVSRSAFLFIAEVGVVLWVIYSIYVFNKEAKMSKMLDTAVLRPLERIDVEQSSKTLVDSLFETAGWLVARVGGGGGGANANSTTVKSTKG